MRISYGIDLKEADDEYYKMAEHMGLVAEEITVPGRFLIEIFPWLQYVPEWFPGAGFKIWASTARRDIHYAVDHLFDAAKAAMVSSDIPCATV